MKKIELNGVIIWQAPEADTYSVRLQDNSIHFCVPEADWVGDEMKCVQGEGKYSDQLPPGDYTHLKPVNELTEDECTGMVEKPEEGYYKNYLCREVESFIFPLAMQSLHSLLRVHSLTPSQCYSVFKK